MDEYPNFSPEFTIALDYPVHLDLLLFRIVDLVYNVKEKVKNQFFSVLGIVGNKQRKFNKNEIKLKKIKPNLF